MRSFIGFMSGAAKTYGFGTGTEWGVVGQREVRRKATDIFPHRALVMSLPPEFPEEFPMPGDAVRRTDMGGDYVVLSVPYCLPTAPEKWYVRIQRAGDSSFITSAELGSLDWGQTREYTITLTATREEAEDFVAGYGGPGTVNLETDHA